MSTHGTPTLDEILAKVRKDWGLPPVAPSSNPRHDEGSGPTVRKPVLKRLRAKSRLANNPKARAAAEAFRDAMKG